MDENKQIVECISKLLLRKTLKNTVFSTVLLGLGMAIYGLCGLYFLPQKVDWSGLWVCLGLIVGFWLWYWVMKYRVNKGYYGGNAEEARELIKFIQQGDTTEKS